MSKEKRQVKIIVGLATVTIISLILSLCFIANKYGKELVERKIVIEDLQRKNVSLFKEAQSFNSEAWKIHLDILTMSIRVLQSEESCSQIKNMIWEKFRVSYIWVVEHDTRYNWDKKQINYLLNVDFLALSSYDQNKIVNELEVRLNNAKNSAKKRSTEAKKEKEEKASVSIKYVPITA